METIFVYTDGGARGNPGPAAIGVHAEAEGGALVFDYKEVIGEATNNVAEYKAVIAALARLREQFDTNIAQTSFVFRLDSELVVKQLRGEYKVKDSNLAKLHAEIKAALADFPHTTFTHVRREQNKEADRLVNEAFDEAA